MNLEENIKFQKEIQNDIQTAQREISILEESLKNTKGRKERKKIAKLIKWYKNHIKIKSDMIRLIKYFDENGIEVE